MFDMIVDVIFKLGLTIVLIYGLCGIIGYFLDRFDRDDQKPS